MTVATALLKVDDAQQWDKFVELHHEIETLRTLQDPHTKMVVQSNATKLVKEKRPTSDYDYVGALRDLVTWLRKKGAKIDGAVPIEEAPAEPEKNKPARYKPFLSIKPASAVEGNGVFVTRDVPAGENLIEVPRSLFMTTESIEESIVLKGMLREEMLADIGSIQLAVKLIYERYKAKSEWDPYIRGLPREYATVYYWSLADIKKIKGTPLFRDVLKMLTLAVRAYYEAYLAVFVHDLMRKSLFTYDTFVWALSSVYSRQNAVPSLETIRSPEYQAAIAEIRKRKQEAAASGTELKPLDDIKLPPVKSVLALIPGFDMFNHEPGPMTSDFIFEEDGLLLRSMKPLKDGEQAYMSYGNRPNAELLLQQGFVPVENPTDYITFSIALAASDPLKAQKEEALKALGLTIEENGHVLLPLFLNRIAPVTLLFMRVLVLKGDASLLSKEALQASFNPKQPLQATTEANARNFYKLKCTQYLNALPEKVVAEASETRHLTPKDNEQQISRSIALWLGTFHELLTSNIALINAM